MRVVEQETLLLLKFVDLAIDAYRAKPAPGQRGRVFETLKDVPWGNLLLGWYLKTLLAHIQNGWLHNKSQSHVLTEQQCEIVHIRTSFSNPAILLPFVSISEPWGSQVITSRVCFGSGRSWRTFSKLSDCRSPSSFCGNKTQATAHISLQT